MNDDPLSEYRDDDGQVRMHQHQTYVQTVRSDPIEFFPVCPVCGILTSENFTTYDTAEQIATMHRRNSGHVIHGF